MVGDGHGKEGVQGMSVDEVTQDCISGRLMISQRRKGYRYGLDALLLATDLPEIKALAQKGCVLELGAGQGAVGLSIASRKAASRVILVERNDVMRALLLANVEHNKSLWGDVDVQVKEVDLREYRAHLDAHSADLVLCNPPYFPLGYRRESEQADRADAHHERHGGLGDFLKAATYCMKHRGWLKMIIPPWRLSDVMTDLPHDLKVLSLRFIHAEPGEVAYLVEIIARRGGGPELTIRPPLFVRDADGMYSMEVARRVAGAALEGSPAEDVVEKVQRASDKKRGMA